MPLTLHSLHVTMFLILLSIVPLSQAWSYLQFIQERFSEVPVNGTLLVCPSPTTELEECYFIEETPTTRIKRNSGFLDLSMGYGIND